MHSSRGPQELVLPATAAPKPGVQKKIPAKKQKKSSGQGLKKSAAQQATGKTYIHARPPSSLPSTATSHQGAMQQHTASLCQQNDGDLQKRLPSDASAREKRPCAHLAARGICSTPALHITRNSRHALFAPSVTVPCCTVPGAASSRTGQAADSLVPEDIYADASAAAARLRRLDSKGQVCRRGRWWSALYVQECVVSVLSNSYTSLSSGAVIPWYTWYKNGTYRAPSDAATAAAV
ncbi:uncharacterized protein K452DRAFT_111421 [Aplosporella prunicola CBS 121167]|uniref:Uncharacterized protein n=1 Tax=Aplosporella prunicola CBS 121167 TaxID=1176127 RepID=A0A6A6AZF3_9PEZI|nr:uncharacterized protein K452DRAFT_111421 [Aplosporella prunicola CBS 121167]KAF2137299.1 hypothetical protein K452DRAFT_111421 [Aplosporella prunicola CBS 121167]